MNLLDAAKNGKFFKRDRWDYWATGIRDTLQGISIKLTGNGSVVWLLSTDDLFANDYVITTQIKAEP